MTKNNNTNDLRFTEGDPEKDFFEQNPHWRYLGSSIHLLKKYSKKLASKIRWAIFLIEDPDSKYFRYSKDKRVALVNDNYLKGDYRFDYDEETDSVKAEDHSDQFVLSTYAMETMSKTKRQYYERETSYELLVASERLSTDLKVKADVQIKLMKIFAELEKFRKEYEEEKTSNKRTRGKEQPGILFTS